MFILAPVVSRSSNTCKLSGDVILLGSHTLTINSVCSEKKGSCVGNLRLRGPVTAQSEGVFLHHLQRSNVVMQQDLSTGLTSGDRIVLSDQEGRLVGIATGYVREVSKTSISCTLDR